MTPILVTPPTAHPVTLQDAKGYCKVEHDEDDAVIEALIASAVGTLDGWTGLLGRCIMPQTWKVSVKSGTVVLPFPDVTEASAGYAAGAAELVVTATDLGPSVVVVEDCEVTFTCAMAPGLLQTARVAVLMLVGSLFEDREGSSASAGLPEPVDRMVNQLRWTQV